MMDHAREDATFATVTLPSRVDSVRRAAAFLVQAAKSMRVPLASDAGFELALVEALNNAVKHGNADQPGAVIVCEIERADRCLTVRILDEGAGFDPQQLPRPDTSGLDIASIPEGGYGLSIIQTVFPAVRTISQAGRFGVEMSLTF